MLKKLDEIVYAGFDGVYLDIVDAFEFFEYEPSTKKWIDDRMNPETKKSYREDMISWVGRIAVYARKQDKDFLVVPQNGSQLLGQKKYVKIINAIGIEDLFTNGDESQSPDHTKYVLSFLKKLSGTSKPVLLVEYGTKKEIIQRSIKGAKENDFLLLITDRPLKTLGQYYKWDRKE